MTFDYLLGGLVALFNIQLGEVIVGGVGSGLYGMLLFAILAVFVAGLRVGRTPEYLGKKLEAKEVKMTVLALILILPLGILGFTALAVVHPEGLKGPLNAGPHGFSEILYVYTSGAGNNGSAFAGISANTFFYNLTNGLAMLIGRYAFIVPMMAVAGSLVGKQAVPPSTGTFPTTGGTFVVLLVSVILIMGGLIFFPALSLGLQRAEGREYEVVPATSLRQGDVVLVEAGDLIPGDGDVIEGIASSWRCPPICRRCGSTSC
jgi:K+-transporting ATPase ATPase A chain